MKDPWITIIVVAYQRYDHLPIMIHSFLTQTFSNWRMVILHDGPDPEHANVVAPYLKKYPSKILYHQSEVRYNDYGHSLRDYGIHHYLDTPWALLTNDDNYYVPTCLDECFNCHKKYPSSSMILFDCLMNIPISNANQYLPYHVQYSYPKCSFIDMGSFIMTSSIMKDVGFTSRKMEADGIFVDKVLQEYPDLGLSKINQTLFVHN